MSIEFAVLGLLSIKPMSGYEIKKIIQESPFMHWSGNNNQIYKALTVLVKERFANSESEFQEGAPAKKIYTITLQGQKQLREWAVSEALPAVEVRKPFLLKLAFSRQLGTCEIRELVSRYQSDVQSEQAAHQLRMKHSYFHPSETKRDEILWQTIYENVDAVYETELTWAKKLLERLSDVSLEEEEQGTDNQFSQPASQPTTRKEGETMRYKVIHKNALKYVYFNSPETPLCKESDFAEIISACAENETNRVIFHHSALSEEFYQLKTGLAGAVIQKLSMYNIKTAVLMPDETRLPKRYEEMMKESNQGNAFKTFQFQQDAEGWLAKR